MWHKKERDPAPLIPNNLQKAAGKCWSPVISKGKAGAARASSLSFTVLSL